MGRLTDPTEGTTQDEHGALGTVQDAVGAFRGPRPNRRRAMEPRVVRPAARLAQGMLVGPLPCIRAGRPRRASKLPSAAHAALCRQNTIKVAIAARAIIPRPTATRRAASPRLGSMLDGSGGSSPGALGLASLFARAVAVASTAVSNSANAVAVPATAASNAADAVSLAVMSGD